MSHLLVSGYGTIQIYSAQYKYLLDVPGVGLNLLFVYRITHTNKKVEFCPDKWVVTEINDKLKVVASRYYDEFEHMYKPRKSSTPPALNKFIAMSRMQMMTISLWHFLLGHTNHELSLLN
jgi:hypothetical protein